MTTNEKMPRAYEQYRKIDTPDGVVIRRCPVCNGPVALWRFSETADAPTSTVVMCEHSDPVGPQTNVFSGCLLFMPTEDFYRATIREAVSFWNDFASALVALRLANHNSP